MGDLSGRQFGGKTRLLGQVKTESLNFHASSSSRPTTGSGGGLLNRASVALPPQTAPGAFTDTRRPNCGEDALKASIRSMRELRESLRHAALLNIMAAANGDSAPSTGLETQPHLFTAPSQLAPPHHKRKNGVSPFSLQVMSSHGSPFPQTTDGGGRSAGRTTRHTHSPNRDRSPAGSPSPQTLVANLLSPRIRTISIPSPGLRATDLPGPFIHKSISQAKECLTRVGDMVRSRATVLEEVEPVGTVTLSMVSASCATAASSSVLPPDVAMIRMSGTGAYGGGATSMQEESVQNHKLETARYHHVPFTNNNNNLERNRNFTGSSAKPSSALSQDTISSSDASSALPKSGISPASTSNGSESNRIGIVKTGEGAKGEAERASSGQQVIGVRRHLTAGKKRELVKRLTEIAKCEAVDMMDPMANSEDEEDSNVNTIPPMIIMSQLHHHNQRLESTRPTSKGPAGERTAGKEERKEKGGAGCGRDTTRGASGLHRTKSLSSLLASTNNVDGADGAGGRRQIPSSTQHQQDGVKALAMPNSAGLERTLSGSMPDLMAIESELQNLGVRRPVSEQHRPLYITERSGGGGHYNTNGAVKPVFTDGIVGKTIRKDGASGPDKAVESRPLLPATHNFRARRGARPTGRRLSLGLRDRGPIDPAITSNASTFTSTTTNIINLVPGNRARKVNKVDIFAGQESFQVDAQPSEYVPSYSQVLPTLTITGLHREMPPHGVDVSNPSTACEFQPTSNTNVNISNSMHLFQQLDDQCEKLQRQLNIGLNLPRRVPKRTHGTNPTTPPMNRADVTDHLQCLPLGEGRGADQPSAKGKDTPQDTCSTSTFRRSSNSHSQASRIIGHAVLGVALSDVDEQSNVGVTGGGLLSDRTYLSTGPSGDHVASMYNSSHHVVNGKKFGSESSSSSEPLSNKNRGPSSSVTETDIGSRRMANSYFSGEDETVGTKQVSATSSSVATETSGGDPVLKSQKEPRYQGPSSRVPEGEARSQFHYVHPSPMGTTMAADMSAEEAREMKYRVLKALDQDVYYDFQHRKYRNAPSTPATGERSATARCSKDEDRARVHFYKVKLDGDF